METYEYRVFEKRGGHRTGFDSGVIETIEMARAVRKGNDFIPKSGSWHIERRPVGEWEEVEPQP